MKNSPASVRGLYPHGGFTPRPPHITHDILAVPLCMPGLESPVTMNAHEAIINFRITIPALLFHVQLKDLHFKHSREGFED